MEKATTQTAMVEKYEDICGADMVDARVDIAKMVMEGKATWDIKGVILKAARDPTVLALYTAVRSI